jgi:hypothetical protein
MYPGGVRNDNLGNVEVLQAEHGLFDEFHHFRPLDQFVHAGATDFVRIHYLVGAGCQQLGGGFRRLADGDDAQLWR